MPYTFTLTSTIPATPQEIYEAWLDSIGHSEMTGAEAVMSDEVGAEVSAWDGYISGRNLELVPGERIVQSWRTTRFSDDHEDSIVSVTLEATDEGTLLTLVHSNVPNDQTSYEEEGWQSTYFEPMQAYFGSRADSREDEEEEEAEEGRAEEVEEESEAETEEETGEGDEEEAAEQEEEEEGDEEEGEDETEEEDEKESEEEGEEDSEESDEEDNEGDDEDDSEEDDDDDEESASPSREMVAEPVLLRPAPEISRSEPNITDRAARAPTRKRAPVRKEVEPPTETTTTKKTTTKKTTTKKTTTKKTTTKKTTTKKTSAKRPPAKKSAGKKTKGKKPAAKKPAAKKTGAKKAAAKKTSAKKKAGKRAGAAKTGRRHPNSPPRRAAKRKPGRGKRR